MEKKTIGKFIAALRKANGMTQKELGEKLYVSDKTVSRWECDECAPDLSLIPSIAEIFGITTDELLRGERNNPDRESLTSEESETKKKAKSEKQLKLMLHSRKKKFTNLSFISIGLIILGLIAAMICNLGFSKGLLGFCLACVFFVAATICQICFTVSFRLLIDEEEEHTEEIKKANTDMVFSSVKIFFGILLTFAFCLPTALLPPDSHYGLVIEFWILFGTLATIVAFLIGFCVYKVSVLKNLISQNIVWLDEQAIVKANEDAKLINKLCIIFASVFAVILLATYIITSSVSESTFIERERFDDPDKFIEYMQSEYDAWYEEGYGDSPAPPHIDGESGYPNRKWSKIDGKDYYYCAHLYESITILQHENGEWDIVVITNDAYYKGTSLYNLLNIGLLSLHFVNLAACVIWYLVATKKRKK